MKFSDIPGHHEAKRRLIEMVQQGRLPHALLISGPVGSGEVMLARAFAQYLHCTGRSATDGDSCGVCPSCRQHESLNHADLHFAYPILKKGTGVTLCEDYSPQWREMLQQDPWMDFRHWPEMLGKANGQPVIYVDEADVLRRKLSMSARTSDLNIAFVWLPERMVPATANSLLKLIEEPEPGSMFIMVSNAPAEILPTVYSRCQRVELRRLSDSEVAAVIGAGLNPADTMAAAHTAEGNVIAARDMLGADSAQRDLDLFMQLMRLAYQRRVGDLKAWGDTVAALGRDNICRFLDYCQRMVRENFILNLGVPDLNYLTADESKFSARFCPFINERNVEGLIKELNDAETDIRGNVSAKIVLFDLAIKVIILLKA